MNNHNSFLIALIFLFTLSYSTVYAQCYPDRHNTSLSSSWLSCSISSSPNADRSRSHWVMYDMDQVNTIKELKIWNINHPDYLNSGAKTIAIDYIDSNGEWQPNGTYSLNRAEGSAFYEGNEISLSEEITSNKILLTVLENHGGTCSGIAEIRFGLSEVTTATEDISEDHFDINISPNPFSDYTSVTIADLEGRDIKYQVINNLGQVIFQDGTQAHEGRTQFGINGMSLAAGTFFLKIIDGQKVAIKKLSHQNQ